MATSVLLECLQLLRRLAADPGTVPRRAADVPAADPAERETLKVALEHSRALFIYHASQRHTSLNYYFVALAALVTGQVTLFTHHELWAVEQHVRFTQPGPWMTTALGFTGIFLAMNFKWIDDRNASLVDTDKAAVAELEERLLTLAHTSHTNIMRRGDAAGEVMKYKKYAATVRRLLLAFQLIFFACAAISWVL